MERVLSVKANYLAEHYGHDVTIVTTSQSGRKPFYPLSLGIKHIDIGVDYETIMTMPFYRRIVERLKATKRHKFLLSNILNEIKPDVTVSMFTHEMSFLPDINYGSSKVLELHFSKHFRDLDAKSNGVGIFKRTINRILDFRDRKAIRKYDKFVVLSHEDAADWGNIAKELCVISNPASFAPSPEECADTSLKKALAIGRFCPQKGFDILIRAWDAVPSDIRAGWTLDIVGSGPDEQKIRSEITRFGLDSEIRLNPPTCDVKSLYRSHSLFCFPSRYEGFGLSLMEAMSFGLACVATDCPCGSNEIIVNQRVGLIVPTNDASAFAKALTKLIVSADLRAKIGREAYQSIQDRYSLESTMEKWQKLFISLTDKK